MPVKKAYRLPIFVSRRVILLKLKGQVIIEGRIRTGMISIGYGKVGIFDMKRSRSIWEVSGTVKFKGSAHLGHGSKLSVGNTGVLEIGNDFVITAESTIIAQHLVRIGDECLISWDTLIMDTDFHEIKNKNGITINDNQPIIIGNKVWIGCRCLLLKGTRIGNNSILGANSLISKDISDQEGLYVGNPAKLRESDVYW